MTTSYDTMQRLKALFSPRSRRGGPGAGFTSLSVDSLHSDASSTISAPIRARFQKKEKTPVLIRISPSPESTPSATPLPSPALTAQIDPNDPFADPIEHVSTTKIANTSYDLSTFGRITIEATANTPQYHTTYSHSPYAISQNSLQAISTESLPLGPQGSGQPKHSRFGRALRACRDRIYKHVDPQTIWSIIDIREIFWPLTIKKAAVLLAVAMLIAAIVITEFLFHWIQQSMAITRRNMLPVLILVIGLEPLMIIIILLVARIPDISAEEASPVAAADSSDLTASMAALEKNTVHDDHSTALVIPCHNSDHDAMKRVLESAYPHFRPQDIFIVDNGRSLHPPSSEFREFIRSATHFLGIDHDSFLQATLCFCIHHWRHPERSVLHRRAPTSQEHQADDQRWR